MSISNIGSSSVGSKGGNNPCFVPTSVLPGLAFPNTEENNFTNSSSNQPTFPPKSSPSTPLIGSPSTSIGMYPPSVSRAGNWGIGGFTTPPQNVYPPCPTRTIASTLGNPQMPSVFLNSRAPMGFNFRMAGASFPYVYKRKPDDENDDNLPSTKQHITEDKVSAHLNSLHLSDKFKNHSLGKRKKTSSTNSSAPKDDDGFSDDNSMVDSVKTSEANSFIHSYPSSSMIDCDVTNKRIIIADEVNQIIPGEAQLPASLLKQLNKPKMEVILWHPPGQIINNIICKDMNKMSKINKLTNVITACKAKYMSGKLPEKKPNTSDSQSISNGGDSSSDSSNGGSPDSGVSITSAPSSLSFLNSEHGPTTPRSVSTNDLFSYPSTSGLNGINGSSARFLNPPNRPASPIPEPMIDDDFSDRMEFNNNNGNAMNFMWLEENNNSALIDLNTIGRSRMPVLDDLPDLPDSDDMDL